MNVAGNRITHDTYGKDRADALAAASWAATERALSVIRQLVQDMIGETYDQGNGQCGVWVTTSTRRPHSQTSRGDTGWLLEAA
ncbi:MAG: hypothetical protein ABI782_00155 [Anaerolineaceae bacterium]